MLKYIYTHNKKAILNFQLLQKIFILNFIKYFKINAFKFKIVRTSEIEILIPSKYTYLCLYYLKNDSSIRCNILSDIVATDFIKNKRRFLVNYILLSNFNYRIRVSTKIKEFENMLSIVSIFNSSLWNERELFDFFGIFFIYNNDLRRILTDYGFKGFALRKDFPLSGYVEIYYDDIEKKIIFKKIDLSQEFKNFIFKKTWY